MPFLVQAYHWLDNTAITPYSLVFMLFLQFQYSFIEHLNKEWIIGSLLFGMAIPSPLVKQ